MLGHYSTGKDRKFVLLEDVFKNFPNMPMILEIKENNDLLIRKVQLSFNLILLIKFVSGSSSVLSLFVKSVPVLACHCEKKQK